MSGANWTFFLVLQCSLLCATRGHFYSDANQKETEEQNLTCLQWETKLAVARLKLANEGPELGKDTRDLVKKASEKLDQHPGCYVM